MKLCIAAAIGFLLLVCSVAAQGKRLPEDITCEQAAQLIQKHEKDAAFVVLDVRTPEEYTAGHLKNAVMIDFKAEDFKQKLDNLDKTKTYLVYCRKGGRSAMAIGMMNELKFKTLFHLYEGYDAWKSRGNATVQ